MRRTAHRALVGLAAFLIVLAVASRLILLPRVERAPIDEYATTVAVAKNAQYFDAASGTVKTQATLTATRTIRGDVKASSGDVAVWDSFLRIENPDEATPLVRATTDRVAFDRKTSRAVNGYGEAVDGKPVRHNGIEYRFPFDVSKTKTYDYYDTVVEQAYPMTYKATEKVKGLVTYRFEQQVPATKTGTLPVPGVFVGNQTHPLDLFTLDRYYADVRTVWVEPRTGAIVLGQDHQQQTLRQPGSSKDVFTLFDATFRYNDKTIANRVSYAKDARRTLALVGSLGPIVELILGVLALALGVVLGRRTGSAASIVLPDSGPLRSAPRPRSMADPVTDHEPTR
jgi:hypothetical protein